MFAQIKSLQEKKTLVASHWMINISLGTFFLLVISNWLSMAFSSEYNWPKGWFINDIYLGFALAGVAINIVLSLLPRLDRGDWDSKYIGTYAFRVLQATVYAAVIYWFVSSMPQNEAECLANGLDQNCYLVRSNIPFQVSALFIGMFVHLLEKTFNDVGDRFVEMIAALFASRFAGTRQKAEKNQQLQQKLAQLRSRYAQMDKQGISVIQHEKIITLCKTALLHLQSNENEEAETVLQELELTLDNPVSLDMRLTKVTPPIWTVGEEVREEIIEGQGFQKDTKVFLRQNGHMVDVPDVEVVNQSLIHCKFPVQNILPGKWGVAVLNTDMKGDIIWDGFEVKSAVSTINSPA